MSAKFFLLSGMLMCATLHATVAYTTNRNDQPITPLQWANVYFDTGDEVAQLFTAQATGILSTLTMAFSVSNNATTRSLENIFIYADNAAVPGTLLEEITNVDVGCSPPNPGFCNSAGFALAGEDATATSVAHPQLVSGQKYWVGAQAVDRVNNPVSWLWGDINSNLGTDVFLNASWLSDSGTDPQALEVDVSSSTPEPGSLSLLLAGGAIVLLKRSRQRVGRL
jgi:hypothetical protein